MFSQVDMHKYISDLMLVKPIVDHNTTLNRIIKVCFAIIFPLLALKLAVKTSQGEFTWSLLTSNLLTLLVGISALVNYSRIYKPIKKRLDIFEKDLQNPQYEIIRTRICDIQIDELTNAFSLLTEDDKKTTDILYKLVSEDGTIYRCNKVDLSLQHPNSIPVEITCFVNSKVIAQIKPLPY